MSGESLTVNAKSDALLSRADIEVSARRYSAVLGAEDPVCSPLRGDLAGLPPTLIHTGGGELFLSEAQELARKAEEAGADVELRVFDGLWHDFHVHAGMLCEADEALAELGDFVAARLLSEASPARS
jgi:acetyl esterase/lipase